MGTYTGSDLFSSLATLTGIPIDQINFMLCQLVALGFAFVYRKYFSPHATSYMLRHVVALAAGIAIGLFCFGRQMVHMFVQAGGCYVLMKWAPGYAMHMCVFVFAMLYMSFIHIQSIIYNYGGYTLDVSMPLMMASQKLTSLAFSLHDGLYKKPESLKFDQKKHAVSRLPHPVVFLSYMFYFQGLMVGPLCFFNDYISFVEGKNFPIERPIIISKKDDDSKKQPEDHDPMPAVLRKLGAAFATMFGTLWFVPVYPLIRCVDKEFIAKTSFLSRIVFLLISAFISRFRYYFAWKLADAVNNASGLGFNGYDAKGKQRWDLITNVRIRGIEGATSFKGIVDNWNIQTAVWLKRTCYERAPFSKTLLTYVLSAVWHGFYPGYYFSFVSASFCTMAARSVRRNVRPYFQMSVWSRRIYDVITWFTSQLTLAYLVVPMVALKMWPVLYFYNYSMFWFIHVITFLLLIFVPYKSTKPQPPKSTSGTDKTDSTSDNSPHKSATTHTQPESMLDVTHTKELEELSEQVNEGVQDTLGFGLPHTPQRHSSDAVLRKQADSAIPKGKEAEVDRTLKVEEDAHEEKNKMQ